MAGIGEAGQYSAWFMDRIGKEWTRSDWHGMAWFEERRGIEGIRKDRSGNAWFADRMGPDRNGWTWHSVVQGVESKLGRGNYIGKTRNNQR